MSVIGWKRYDVYFILGIPVRVGKPRERASASNKQSLIPVMILLGSLGTEVVLSLIFFGHFRHLRYLAVQLIVLAVTVTLLTVVRKSRLAVGFSAVALVVLSLCVYAAGYETQPDGSFSSTDPRPTGPYPSAVDAPRLPSYEQLSFTNAAYLALGTAITVGSADITPVSQDAHLLVASQMVWDVLVLGLLVSYAKTYVTGRPPASTSGLPASKSEPVGDPVETAKEKKQ